MKRHQSSKIIKNHLKQKERRQIKIEINQQSFLSISQQIQNQMQHQQNIIPNQSNIQVFMYI